MQKINGRIPKGKEKGFSPFFNKKKNCYKLIILTAFENRQ